ncbi:MAG: hypothetical protein ACP6IS_10420 [Candidatus Asgardarchaeia archaeon]
MIVVLCEGHNDEVFLEELFKKKTHYDITITQRKLSKNKLKVLQEQIRTYQNQKIQENNKLIIHSCDGRDGLKRTLKRVIGDSIRHEIRNFKIIVVRDTNHSNSNEIINTMINDLSSYLSRPEFSQHLSPQIEISGRLVTVCKHSSKRRSNECMEIELITVPVSLEEEIYKKIKNRYKKETDDLTGISDVHDKLRILAHKLGFPDLDSLIRASVS